MASARPVRIVRKSVPTEAVRVQAPAPLPGRSGESDAVRPNRAATQRAWRLFALFLGAVTALLAGILGLLNRDPGGLSASLTVAALLVGLSGVVVAIGWAVTLGQTPRAIRTAPASAVVIDRLGRSREIRLDPGGDVSVVRRFPAGWLAGTETEIVRVRDVRGITRTYLVDSGLLASPDRASP